MAEEQALGQGMQAGLNSAEKGLAYGLQGAMGAFGDFSSSTPTPTYTPTVRPLSASPTVNYGGPFSGDNQSIDPLDALYGVRAGNFVQPSGTYDPTGLEDLGMEAGRSMTTVPSYAENIAALPSFKKNKK
jgi:hypothetical protein